MISSQAAWLPEHAIWRTTVLRRVVVAAVRVCIALLLRDLIEFGVYVLVGPAGVNRGYWVLNCMPECRRRPRLRCVLTPSVGRKAPAGVGAFTVLFSNSCRPGD